MRDWKEQVLDQELRIPESDINQLRDPDQTEAGSVYSLYPSWAPDTTWANVRV